MHIKMPPDVQSIGSAVVPKVQAHRDQVEHPVRPLLEPAAKGPGLHVASQSRKGPIKGSGRVVLVED